MLRFEERDDVTVQNPPAGEVVLFYTDGAFRIKDSAGEVTTITTVEGLEEVAAATEPKVYVALLSQTGVLAPVATVLKNTLGGTVVWTYDNVGKYIGTLASTFTEDKTFCLSQVANTETPDIVNSFGRATTNTVSLQVFVPGFGFSDVFTDLQVRIEVYP